MSYFLKTDQIKGAASAQNHKDWIEIDSFDFGTSHSIHTKTGIEFDRQVGSHNISELVLTKKLDSSSPYLFQYACTSKPVGNVTFDACNSADGSNNYLRYTLKNVLISHYDISGAETIDNNSKPMETIHLNFTSLEMQYTAYDEHNRAQSPIASGYDLSTRKAL